MTDKKLNVKLVEVVLSGSAQGLSDDVEIHPIAGATLAGFAMSDPDLASAVSIEVVVVKADERPEDYIALNGLDAADVVGFTTYTWNDLHIRAAAKAVSSSNPGALVVLGGPQAGHAAHLYVRPDSGVDVVVSGPGEEPFRRLLRAQLGEGSVDEIPGVTYLKGDAPQRVTGECGDEPELIPSPFQTGFVEFSGDGPHAVYLETFRGCVHSCGFCLWGVGRQGLDSFPIEQVLADIDLVYSTPNIANVYFVDAYLFYLPKRARAIIARIEQAPFQHPTFFEFDPRHLKRDHIDLVKNVCGHDYRLGIQSFDLAVLHESGRKQRAIEDLQEKVALIREVDEEALVSFALIYGLPGDSLDGFRATLSEAIRLDADALKINVLSVLRGTPFWNARDRYKLVFEEDPPHRLLESASFSGEDLSECARLSMWVVFLLNHEAVKYLFRSLFVERPDYEAIQMIDRIIEGCVDLLPQIEDRAQRVGLSVEAESQNRIEILKLSEDPVVRRQVLEVSLDVFGAAMSDLADADREMAAVLTDKGDLAERAWRR